MAKANPKRVVFAEANHVNMLKAAVENKAGRHLLSDSSRQRDRLQKLAAEGNISLEGIEIVNMRDDRKRPSYPLCQDAYRAIRHAKASPGLQRPVRELLKTQTHWHDDGRCGDADAFVSGV